LQQDKGFSIIFLNAKAAKNFAKFAKRFLTIYAKNFFNELIFCVTCASFAHLAVTATEGLAPRGFNALAATKKISRKYSQDIFLKPLSLYLQERISVIRWRHKIFFDGSV
jgi:hypothetical protein